MATFRKRGERWQAIVRRHNLKASKAFDRLVDAKAWARAQEREADLAGVLPGKLTGTLAPVIERYEREIWPTKRWGAGKANMLAVLKRDLGSRQLSGLTKTVLLTYAREMDAGPATVLTRLSYLSEVLRTARDLWSVPVLLDDLQAAVATARSQQIAGPSIPRTRRPTQAEIDAIVAFGDKREKAIIDLGVVVRVLSVLPIRAGELVSIQWDDINADRRTVVLRERKHPSRRLKDASVEEIPLITFGGVDTFDLIASRPRYLSSPFPYKRFSITAAFTDAAIRLGIKDLHLHDLRAHALSALLEANMPIPQVALISGHRNWKILARHYARLDPASVHETVRRLA